MSNKWSGSNVLLNIHQSLRAEQAARTQQFQAAILAGLAQQQEYRAAGQLRESTEAGERLVAIQRKLGEEARRGADVLEQLADLKGKLTKEAGWAAEQSRLRETIFTIRSAAESLSIPQGANADEIISKCTELARTAPPPSAFDALDDKEYCRRTIQLIEQKAAEARRAIEPRILAEYEARIEGLDSDEETNPLTVLFQCLALRGDFPDEAAFEDDVHRVRLRALLNQLEAKENAAREALTQQEIATVELLLSGPQRFAEQASDLATACATAQPYHDTIMELAQLVRRLRAATVLLSPRLRKSQRWVEDLNRWEEEVLRPHQDNLFQFECMVLAAKADGQLSKEEESVLHKAGQSIGLRHATAKKIVAETKSVSIAQFTGNVDRAERVIASLFDVACADGHISKEEAAFIQKTANALGIARERWMQLYEKSKIDFLNAQIPRLAEEHIHNAPDVVGQILKWHEGGKLFVDPHVPPNKLSNAGRFGLPSEERVVALLDLTESSSAKFALVFGTKGLYWCCPSSQGTLTYSDLLRSYVTKTGFPPKCQITQGKSILGVIDPGVGWTAEDLCQLFDAIKSGLRAGWYVARSLNIEGPFTQTDALGMLWDGRINPDKDFVLRPGMTAWEPVRDIPDLRIGQ